MIPVLFPADAQSFDEGGLSLSDAVSCVVNQDVYGRSELTLQYPLIGAHFSELAADRILVVKPDPYTRTQPFRITRASRPINGVVSFFARHLVYDMMGIPVAGFTANGSDDALRKLKSFALTSVPFTFTSYYHSGRPLAFDSPRSLREMLVSDDHSFLRTYGGVLEFDRRTVTHRASAGADRGVVITYGRDLIDLQQEENIADTWNGAIGFWDGVVETVAYPGTEDEEVIQNTGVVFGSKRMAAGSWPVEKVRLLDLTNTFGSPLTAAPTQAEIDEVVDLWISEHNLGVPEVSIRLKYADVGQDVRLRDTVRVDFALLGVQTSATVTAMTYDALQEIVTNIQIGTPREDLPDSILDASRLNYGTINSERIGKGSIGGRHIAAASISEAALQAYAVTKSRLAALAVSGDKIENGAVSAQKLDDDLQELLAYAEDYHDATGEGTLNYPAYFTAGVIAAISSFYGSTYYVAVDPNHDGTINAHTHTIVDNNDGTLTVGPPDFLGGSHPFDMSATAFFRNALAAIGVATVTELAYTTASDKSVTIQDANIRYIDGYLKGRALVTLDNGKTARVYIEMDATKAASGICPAMGIKSMLYTQTSGANAYSQITVTFDDDTTATYSLPLVYNSYAAENETLYNYARYIGGRSPAITNRSVTPTIYDEGHPYELPVEVTFSTNGNAQSFEATVNVRDVYESGREAGGGGGICPMMEISSVAEHSYSSTADFSLIFDNAYLRYDSANDLLKGRILVTMEDGNTQSVFVQMDAQRKALTPPAYAVTNGNVQEDQNNPYSSSDPYVFNVVATFSVDGNSKSYSSWVNVYDVYQAGYTAGSSDDTTVYNIGYETDEYGNTDYQHIWIRLTNGNLTGNHDISDAYLAGYSAGETAGYSDGRASVASVTNAGYERAEGGAIDYSHIWVRLENGVLIGNIPVS